MQIIVDGFHLAARWRLRHIPGPTPLWLVGNTLEVAAQQYFLFKAWEVWGRKYGKVFKWFWGPQPVVAVRGGCPLTAMNLCATQVTPYAVANIWPQQLLATRLPVLQMQFVKKVQQSMSHRLRLNVLP